LEIILLGRPYRLTLARVKRRKTRVRGKEYERPDISVPREDLEWVLRGGKEAVAIVLLARASTVNLLDWAEEDELWRALPQEARTELYYHGQAPEKPSSKVVLIAAEEEELRRLGLDPLKPITLEDIIRAVREKILPEVGPRAGRI